MQYGFGSLNFETVKWLKPGIFGDMGGFLEWVHFDRRFMCFSNMLLKLHFN